jgi:hypothetical protein
MQSNLARGRLIFLLATMASFALIEMIFRTILHPYFRGVTYQSIQFVLALSFVAIFIRRRSVDASLLFATMVGGYFVGLLSYIIKWGFFDSLFGLSRHLSDVGRALFSFDPWLMSIFTYCWIALPLAVFFSHLIVRGIALRTT